MPDDFKIYIISHLGWEEQCEKQQRPTFPLQRSPLLTQTYSRWEIHQHITLQWKICTNVRPTST